MSEPKLILKAELVDGKIKTSFGTGNTAILSLAVQICDLRLKEILLDKEVPAEEPIIQTVSSDIISKL